MLLNFMVGKFVGERQADPAWLAVRRNQINAGDFGFFTAVLAEGGDFERLAMSAKNGAATFVKPFRRDAD